MSDGRTSSGRLAALLADARVLSPTRFVVGDGDPVDLEALGLTAAHRGPAESLLRPLLAGHLYNLAYVRTYPDGAPPLDPTLPAAPGDAALVNRVAGSRTSPRYDPGWRVRVVQQDGSAVVDKAGWTRVAGAGQWSLVAGSDSTCWLLVPPPHPDPQGTFLFVYGTTLGDGVEQGDMLRIYLHTRPAHAAATVGWLADELDRRAVPYTMKTMLAPASADRTDATVLYVARRYHRHAVGTVRELPDALLAGLGADTPLFTLRAHDGVGLAEDPSTGESFGMHRMGLVADGLLDAWRTGEERDRCVADRFAAAGVDLEAPHLAPGSRRCYDLDWEMA